MTASFLLNEDQDKPMSKRSNWKKLLMTYQPFKHAFVVGTTAVAQHNPTPAHNHRVQSRQQFIQCSGHEDAFHSTSRMSSGTILKKVSSISDNEVIIYEQLKNDPLMSPYIPKFHQTVQRVSASDNGKSTTCDTFIELENLLCKFNNNSTSFQSLNGTTEYNKGPFVMDIKMGTRTFLESEVSNFTLRSDLYEKMVKLDPGQPTEEERRNAAITKLRYMTFRESLSSSSNLGFRIEGVQPELQQMVGKDYQRLKQVDEISDVLNMFIKSSDKLRIKLVERLKQLKSSFLKSDFFKRHEVIGSSLLIIHDGNECIDVWMIDFAKTVPVPSDTIKTINHMTPWSLGNHEDGYVFGLNNLIDIIEGDV